MLGELKSLFDNKFFEEALSIKAINDRPFMVKHFTIDSRVTGSLYCFIGIKGEKYDGNDFFDKAYEFGVRELI